MSGKVLIERWLTTTFASVTYQGKAVNLYRHPAPTTAIEPFITITVMTADDKYFIGNPYAYEEYRYRIRVWDKGQSTLRVNAIARDIHNRIHMVPPINVDGGHISSCVRAGVLVLDTFTERNGEFFVADGGDYRFMVVTNA